MFIFGKMAINKLRTSIFLLAVVIFFTACQNEKNGEIHNDHFRLRMNIFSQPKAVSPLYYSSNTEKILCNLLFQPLLSVNDSSNGLTPVLAENLPVVEINEQGDIIHYKLREDAIWSDGSDLSSRDVLFSFKSFLNPHAQLSYLEDYFGFIDSVVAESPKEFTVYCNRSASDNLFRSGDYEIMPAYIFDPDSILDDYSFHSLKDYNPENGVDSVLLEYGNFLQDLRILEDSIRITGTGAYFVDKMVFNQNIILRKKEDWWGDKHANESFFFQSHPDEIEFKIFMDNLPATMSFINEELEVLFGVNKESTKMILNQNSKLDHYKKIDYNLDAFVYLAINTQASLTSDPKVRKALALLSNPETYVEKLMEGEATTINSFIFPEKSMIYNSGLSKKEFNPSKAEDLLNEAGWLKKDGEWYRNEEKVSIEFLIQSGNSNSENYAVFFKNQAETIGLQIDIIPLEFSTLINRIRSGDFTITRLGTSIGPMFSNYRSLFHSSVIGNSNYPRIISKEIDSIIEKLEMERNTERIIDLTLKLQEQVSDQNAYIFLYRPKASAFVKENIEGFHKTPSSTFPWPGAFKLKNE